ncbi:MAG: carboxymuconolactone decarboxylase family protein [Verrucomicrobia bacterium]|nr:carboxymuconolactone decarboxylase family protein [Verrucomicrobiota bacterium]
MHKNYKAITADIRSGIGELRKDIPDVVQGFNAMSAAAVKDGALDAKTKELIALAIGVATHCDGCIGFHTQALARLKASRAEVTEALGMAVYMGGGPSLMYAADAIQAFMQANAEA